MCAVAGGAGGRGRRDSRPGLFHGEQASPRGGRLPLPCVYLYRGQLSHGVNGGQVRLKLVVVAGGGGGGGALVAAAAVIPTEVFPAGRGAAGAPDRGQQERARAAGNSEAPVKKRIL